MAGNQDAEAHRQTYQKGKSELAGRSASEHIGGLGAPGKAWCF
jgi:hypothetical protein